jgi:hypothetical protein
MPSSLVYFEGEWSAKEKGLVETAIETIEISGRASAQGDLTAPWIATSHALGESGVYLASRRGLSGVLTAETAEGLAEKIRQVDLGGLSSSPRDVHPKEPPPSPYRSR